MEKLKVVFIGGLTNGEIVYMYLKNNKYVDLCLTITHEKEAANKPRYIDLDSEDAKIIRSNKANMYSREIIACEPDYIFVAGWSEMLKEEILESAKNGTIGFHPSILPQDRGRSVLAWQIEEGYTETGVTMFYYNDLPDAGDIIACEKIKIKEEDYISDILNKVDDAIYSLMFAYFPMIRLGIAPRTKQDINEGNFRRLRKSKDSLIIWERTSQEIYNKIRAISKPYPGAFYLRNEGKIVVWKAEIITDFDFGNDCKPGDRICTLHDGSHIYKTKDSFLRIVEWEEV